MDRGKVKPTFFNELRCLGRNVERQTDSLKAKFGQTDRQFCYPLVIKKVTDTKQSAKALNKKVQEESQKVRGENMHLEELLSAATAFLSSQQESLTQTEEMFCQYGFHPWKKPVKTEQGMDGPSPEPTEFQRECLTDMDKDEDKNPTAPKTPVQNPQGVEKSVGQEAHGNRTPQLEDFGLSQGTLKFLESVAVVKRGPTNNAVQEKKPEPRRAHDPNIPSFFQHNGIITTPSLTRDLGIMDSTINHAALASPIISSQSSGDSWEFNKQPFPVSNLKFDENNGSGTTPQTPVLRTPGFREKFTNAQAHNNLTYSCAQSHEEQGYSHKRPVNVGLFKPAAQSSVKGKLPVKDDGFPQSPELTYSLEEISEMTGVFKINPVAPPPPVLSSLQGGADKENATPPEPELLSERISRIKQADKIRTVDDSKSSALSNDLPASPKFLGSYNFLKK